MCMPASIFLCLEAIFVVDILIRFLGFILYIFILFKGHEQSNRGQAALQCRTQSVCYKLHLLCLLLSLSLSLLLILMLTLFFLIEWLHFSILWMLRSILILSNHRFVVSFYSFYKCVLPLHNVIHKFEDKSIQVGSRIWYCCGRIW